MKPGEIIEFPDGEMGTVVYHGLDGYGVLLGHGPLAAWERNEILDGIGNLHLIGVNGGEPKRGHSSLEPEAMVCNRCHGSGAIDAPYSGVDPCCPECNGQGYRGIEDAPRSER